MTKGLENPIRSHPKGCLCHTTNKSKPHSTQYFSLQFKEVKAKSANVCH